MLQAYWTKSVSSLLLAGLLLTGCSTKTYSNEFERYLSTIDVKYTLVTEKCDVNTTNRPYNIQFDTTTIGVNCLVGYTITPLVSGYENDVRFYLVYAKESKSYYFISKNYIVNDNGKLITFSDYFGGK